MGRRNIARPTTGTPARYGYVGRVLTVTHLHDADLTWIVVTLRDHQSSAKDGSAKAAHLPRYSR